MNRYSISEAKKALKTGIKGYLAKNESGEYFMNEVNRLPFYLEGNPGIGKTQMVGQVAQELGIGFVSFSITHHSRNTVLGLPVINEVSGTKYTEYTMSEIIAKVLACYERGKKEGILLLDEFNCMSDTIMPVMLSFLQTKNIGMHTLPEGWVIVLCGNPSSYNKSARKFDFAILDRLRRLSVEFRSEDFLHYAEEHSFEKEIQDYLAMNRESIYLCSNEKEENLATARAWENLDIAIKMLTETGEELDEKMVGQFIKSDRVAKDFYKFYLMQNSMTLNYNDLEKILDGLDRKRYLKILEKLEFYIKIDVASNLVKLISGKVRDKKISVEKCSQCVNNVIAIFRELNDLTCLEKMYNLINEDKVLMKVLSTVETKEYVDLVQRIYFGQKAV